MGLPELNKQTQSLKKPLIITTEKDTDTCLTTDVEISRLHHPQDGHRKD